MTHREFRALFPEFGCPSWQPWNAIEDAIFGMEPSDIELVRRVTGRAVLPTKPVAEFWAIKGRGGGGSRFTSRLGCVFGTTREFKLAPGENIFIGIFAPDKKQATLTHRYIRGLLQSVPALAAMIVNETKDAIELCNGVIIEVLTASASAPRGRAYVLVIVEEAAFLPQDDSADPDVELLRAVRPALARVPGSLLAVIGSPYAPRGELYRAWREGFGRDDDEDRLVVAADTLTLNPTFSAREISRAFREDPVAAASEYGRDGVIVFRSDVAGLLTDAALAAVVPVGVRERPPGPAACAHFDAATGSGEDAAGLAIAFVGTLARLAALRHWRPPFNPSIVADEATLLLRRYGVRELSIDRYAPGLVADLFRTRGIACKVAERDTSATFIELLALVNSLGVSLLDDPVLLRELTRLERRPTAGREQVSHPRGGHDDLAAAAANAVVLASQRPAGATCAVIMPTVPANNPTWRQQRFR